MTEAEIEDVFHRANGWPAEKRAHAAYLLRQVELGADAAYDILPEQRRGIEAGLADARAQHFASDASLAVLFSCSRQRVRYTDAALHALDRIQTFVESPMVWLFARGLVEGATAQIAVEPWMMGIATTMKNVRCHVVPVVHYAIYYEIAEGTVTILSIAYGPRLVWAHNKPEAA
jgi:hypothetical protein